MTTSIRFVQCIKLGKKAQGLSAPPYPGELGQTIYEKVSQAAWDDWMAQQTRLINENRINTLDKAGKIFLKNAMKDYLFGHHK